MGGKLIKLDINVMVLWYFGVVMWQMRSMFIT